MRFSAFFLAGLLWVGVAQARPTELTISLEGEAPGLWVTLVFDGDRDGRTLVRMPDRFGYAHDLWRNVTDISVQGGRMAPFVSGDLVVDHAPSQPLTLRYRVRTQLGLAPALGVEVGPSLADDGAAFLGETVIAYPEGRLDGPVMVRLAPPPVGWALASDLQAGGQTTLRDARESYLITGPGLRIVDRRLPDGSVLKVALRGRLGFTDVAVADRAAAIVAYQRRFWNAPASSFLITITEKASRPGIDDWGGQGRGPDGAALYASREVRLGKFSEILAHESAHAWFARALGGLPSGLAEPEGYWFSEGFCDYLAYRTLAEIGAMSPSDLQWMFSVRSWSEPVSQARMKSDYWREPGLFDQPYIQGFHLALIWDERLRASGKGLGLRDVLLAQAKRAAEGGAATADKLFPATYKALSGLDLSADIDRYLVRGEPVVLSEPLLHACGQIAEVETLDQAEGVKAMGDPAHCAAAAFGSGI